VTDAVIVATARTALAKSWKGAFNMTYGATLGAHAVRHAVGHPYGVSGERLTGHALIEGRRRVNEVADTVGISSWI
jgi:acetyl-CoA acetyltransferase